MFQGENCWENKGQQLRCLLQTLKISLGYVEYFFHFMEAQGLTSGCLLSAHLVTSLSPEARAVS